MTVFVKEYSPLCERLGTAVLFPTASGARAGKSSLRSSSAWATHSSVSRSTAACHKSSSRCSPAHRHETALPPRLPLPFPVSLRERYRNRGERECVGGEVNPSVERFNLSHAETVRDEHRQVFAMRSLSTGQPTVRCGLIWDFSHGFQHKVKLFFQIAPLGDRRPDGGRGTLRRAVGNSDWQKRPAANTAY